MAITLNTQADSNTAGTTGQVTVTAAAGDLIVVTWVIRNGAAFSSLTDDRSQTYNEVTTPVSVGGSLRVGIHYVMNAAAGSTTITLTAGSSDTIIMNASCWSGAATSSAVADFDTATNTAVTTHPHGSVDAAAGQLIITVAGQGSTITDETVASNYTALQLSTGGNNRQWWQYRIASGALTGETGAYTASSHNSGCMIAVFAEAAGGSSTTVNPTTGALTMSGLTPSTNAFTNVRIREVLINEAGSPLASMTGLSLVIWYDGAPVGTPDLSYSAVTTDVNGTMSYSIATGSLVYNQAIFYVATDGSSSLSAWTCARMVPTYS